VRGWVQSLAELFTLSPQRAFGYAGLVAVILFATVVGGIYWKHAGTTNNPTVAAVDNKNSAGHNDKATAKQAEIPSPSPCRRPQTRLRR
jgi:hypothetical protein